MVILGVPALRIPPCGSATEPPSEGLGRVGQLEDKGLTGSLPSGARQRQRRDAASTHAIASMTDQQENRGRTTCLPWDFGVFSIEVLLSGSWFTLDTLVLEIASCQKTNKQANSRGRPWAEAQREV